MTLPLKIFPCMYNMEHCGAKIYEGAFVLFGKRENFLISGIWLSWGKFRLFLMKVYILFNESVYKVLFNNFLYFLAIFILVKSI
jgi:hypothetical protein